MSLKITGAEFKQFYADEAIWGGSSSETYHDDLYIKRNGADLPEDFDYTKFEDTDALEIESGYIVFPADGTDADFQATIIKWQENRTSVMFNVSCPKALEDVVKAAIKAAGGTV